MAQLACGGFAELFEQVVDEAGGAEPDGVMAAAAAGLVAAGGDGVEGGEVVAGEGGVASTCVLHTQSIL